MTHSQPVTLSGSLRVDLHRYTKDPGDDTPGMKRQMKSQSVCKYLACAMDFTESAISRYSRNKIPLDRSRRDDYLVMRLIPLIRLFFSFPFC